jgi:hypothetical protein
LQATQACGSSFAPLRRYNFYISHIYNEGASL